ncbi:hypothetical protein EBU71_21685 [bacterium]|nr:hypothetical protein [Candidatus Elulimicrobium humile]
MSNTFNSANQQILKISNGGTGWVSNANGYAITPNVTVNNDPSSLEVKGKIIHNGRDLEERLQTIEQVLQIPERDIELEKKYPKLKKLFEEYIKELSKRRMWEELKK